MSKSSMKSTSLQTIGTQNPVQKLESAIGIELSERGVVNLIATAEKEFPGQMDQEAGAKALCNSLMQAQKLPGGVTQWGKTLLTFFLDENENERKAARITAMLAHWPTQEQNPAMMAYIIDDYLSALEGIPSYAVESGVRALLNDGPKRKPTIAQVKEYCEPKARNYLALKDFIKRLKEHWGE